MCGDCGREEMKKAVSSCASVKMLIFSNKQERVPQLLVFPAAVWVHPQMGC